MKITHFSCRIFVLSFLMLFVGNKLSAQISSTGKNFYMSFMEMETRSGAFPDTLIIYVTSEVNTSIVMDNPRVSGSNQTINITAGKVNRIVVDPTYYYPVGSEFISSNVNSKKCLRIVAKDLVNVYCLNLEINRSDGTFVMPYESMPSAPEFFAVCFPPDATITSTTYAESEFMIVGMDANVKVEITPTADTKGGVAAGTVFTVTLAKGQTYQVQSKSTDGTNSTDPAATSWATTGAKKGDLTGSRIRVIEGCGKINVFSGNRSAYVSKSNCGTAAGRDHLYTQVTPINVLGKEYVLMPYSGQSKGYCFKVVAAYDTTLVYVNGTLINTILKRGQWIYQEITTGAATCITTSKPAYVAQFMKNGACSGLTGSNGDAALFISPAVNQKMLKAVTGTATTSNMNKHWVNVLVNKTATSSVKLNGVAVPSSSFTDACTNYSYAMLAVNNPSTNKVESDSGFICVSYGVGPYESYSYSAGAIFENIDYDIKITRKTQCPGEDVKIDAIVPSSAKVKGYLWNFGDGSTGTGKSVTHKFTKLGSFYVVVKIPVTSDCGSVDTVTRSKIINIRQGPILNFPDTTTQCSTAINLKFYAPSYTNKFIFKWQDSSTTNSFTAKKQMKIWLRVKDTSTNCISIDSTYLRIANAIVAGIKYDSLDMCYKTDKFYMSDATIFKNDRWKSSSWRIFDSHLGIYVKGDSIKFKYKFDTISTNKLRYIVNSFKGCADTLDTLLVVYPYPLAKLAASSPYFCQKTPMTFYDSSKSVEGIGKSIWLYGDGATDTVPPNKVKHTFKTDGSFIVRLITVTPFGCRDTIDSTFVVRPTPVNVIDVKKINGCLKTNLWDFTDKSTISSGSYLTAWSYGKNLTATTSSIKSVKFTDTGWQLVILKNTSTYGCADIDTAKVFVAPEPKAYFNATDSFICFSGNFFSFEDASTAPKNAQLNLRADWKYQDNTTNYAKTVLKKTFPVPGKFWVRIIATTTDGCKDSFQRNVEIYPMPKSDIKPSSTVQCLTGNKFIFKQKYPFADANATHTWKSSDAGAGALDSFVHSFAAVGNYRVFHSTQSQAGCYDSTSVVVSVVASPKTIFITNKDTNCLGGKFNFTDKTVFGTAYTSKWSFGDGNTSTSKDVAGFSYTAPGKYIVKLLLATSTGCTDSTTKTLDVWPIPQANFAMNSIEQCLVGNSFVASNITSENSATGCSYTWSVKGVPMFYSKAISPQTLPDTGNYPLKLFVVSDKGCASSKTIVLRVNENPVVTIAGNNACAETPIKFISTAKLNRGTVSSYAWDFGDGGAAAIANPLHAFALDGNYNVTLKVTSDKGCTTTTPNYPVIIAPKPIADFDAEYLLSKGLQTDWKFTFKGKNTDTYNWIFQDGQTSTSDIPFLISFNGTGNFKTTLIAINSYGCSDTMNKTIFLKPELLFYLPNSFSPNIDGLNEEFKPYQSFGLSKYRMTILNRWGEILFYSEDPNVGWKGLDKLGFSVLEGAYAYAVTFRYIDGAMHAYSGTVTVLR